MSFLEQFAAKVPSNDVGVQKIDPGTLISGVLNAVYIAGGVAAVIVIIVAGILYTTSNGDAAKIQKAKNAILYAVIGLVVIVLAFTITNVVIQGVA